MNDLLKVSISKRDAIKKYASSDPEYITTLNMIKSAVLSLSSEFSTPVQLGKINEDNIDSFMDIIVVASEAQADGDDSPMMDQARTMLRQWNQNNKS